MSVEGNLPKKLWGLRLKRFLLGSVLLCSMAVCYAGESLVPKAIVDDFKKGYTEEELDQIQDDLKVVEGVAFKGKRKSSGQPVYLATCGGPGSSKSTILEIFMDQNPYFKQACVYVDPDQRGLRFMVNTYIQSLTCFKIGRFPTYQDCARAAYEKWRGASNFIANTLLNRAYDEGYSIAHGTTSQSPVIESLYKKLQAKGYKIMLLVCMSSPENRLEAVKNREEHQGFVQSTPTDFVEKQAAVLKNFPIYFKYADDIKLYWVEDFKQGSILVGTYTQAGGLKVEEGKEALLAKICEAYDAVKSADMPTFDAITKPRA